MANMERARQEGRENKQGERREKCRVRIEIKGIERKDGWWEKHTTHLIYNGIQTIKTKDNRNKRKIEDKVKRRRKIKVKKRLIKIKMHWIYYWAKCILFLFSWLLVYAPIISFILCIISYIISFVNFIFHHFSSPSSLTHSISFSHSLSSLRHYWSLLPFVLQVTLFS